MKNTMLYDDYIKYRNAKKGDKVTMSDGSIVEKVSYGNLGGNGNGKIRKHPTLDQYDAMKYDKKR